MSTGPVAPPTEERPQTGPGRKAGRSGHRRATPPAVAATLALLASCALRPLHPPRAALEGLVGLSEEELTARLGRPDQVEDLGGQRFLSYEAEDLNRVGGRGAGPPRVAAFRCRTVFAVSDGVVRAYSLRGNGC